MIKRNNIKRIITTLIIAVMALTTTVSVSFGATSKLSGVDVPSKYKKGYQVINCLDISRWQSKISADDWKTIKKSGVDAVIIRAGYSSYSDLEHHVDKHFKENINNASKAGLDVGVYYFSAAITKEEAKSEAEYFVDIINPYRDKITLPVVLDFESNEKGRLSASKMRSIGVEGCTEMCEAFLEVIAEAGYDPMIYANRATLDNYLDHEKLQSKYKIWLAQYTRDGSAPTYSGDYYMWQYSSDVRLSGISARVDANYLFKEDQSATAEIVPISLYVDDEENTDSTDESKDSKGDGNKTAKTGSGFFEPDTVSFHIGDGVSSEVPITSDEKSATVTVTDVSGYVHKYKLYKAEKNNQTETMLATLFNGYFKSRRDIDPEYIEEKVLPAVFGDKYKSEKDKGNTLSMQGITNLLSKLNLSATYKTKIDDNVYVDIKSHLVKGKPVIIWTRTNNDKWGNNTSQMMLLIGMDENGYAILVDPIDREWSKSDQRVKLVSVTELVDYMKNSTNTENNFTGANDGGYILVDR